MRHPDEDDKWQETWDKMEEAERRERDIGEFARQDREDKGLAHLEERRRQEPPIGDPCVRCDGSGKVTKAVPSRGNIEVECGRCHGTGVW